MKQKQPGAEESIVGLDLAAEGAVSLSTHAADGTDLTVIRWMLAMSPEDRLRWLQTHMRGVAALGRDLPDA